MKNAATIRRIALVAAAGSAVLALGAFGWGLVSTATDRPASAATATAIGALALAGFVTAFLVAYVLDTRRDSRQLRSAATYARHSAERTRLIAADTKRVNRATQSILDRPLPPSMEYFDQRFRQTFDALTEQNVELHSGIASAASQLLERTHELLMALGAVRTKAGGMGDQSLTLELDKVVDRIYALNEGLLATYTVGPTSPLAPMRGWAISSDLSALLVSLIAAERPATVLELGSGVSTAIMALALARNGAGRLISLEHEPRYAEKTAAMLRQHGVDHIAQVVHAPLVEHVIQGEKYLWYDTSGLDLAGGVDLVLIDGPPKTTGPRARYPALHVLAEHLNEGSLIVVDDTNRKEEIEMISSWAEEVRPLVVEFLPHEKGTAVIRFEKA